MGKPIVNKINTYDAVNDCVVTFNYVGNQPYKNRLVIIDTLTNNIVLVFLILSHSYLYYATHNYHLWHT